MHSYLEEVSPLEPFNAFFGPFYFTDHIANIKIFIETLRNDAVVPVGPLIIHLH